MNVTGGWCSGSTPDMVPETAVRFGQPDSSSITSRLENQQVNRSKTDDKAILNTAEIILILGILAIVGAVLTAVWGY